MHVVTAVIDGMACHALIIEKERHAGKLLSYY